MARNILNAFDAINRAKGVSLGIEALVSLMMGCSESNAPNSKALAELLLSINKDLDAALNEAESSLQ